MKKTSAPVKVPAPKKETHIEFIAPPEIVRPFILSDSVPALELAVTTVNKIINVIAKKAFDKEINLLIPKCVKQEFFSSALEICYNKVRSTERMPIDLDEEPTTIHENYMTD